MGQNKHFSAMDHREKTRIRNAFEDIFSYYDVSNGLKIERILYAKEFLKISDKDIASASALYDIGIYSNAIYFLQQSVEKISKAYASGFFFLDKKSIRGVSHYSPLAFTKVMEKFGAFISSMDTALYDTEIISPDVVSNAFDYNKHGNMLKKNAKDAARMKSSDISSLLAAGAKTTSLLSDPALQDNFRDMLVSAKEEIENRTTEHNIEYELSAVDFILNNLDDFFTDNYYMYITELYILGSITYPHEHETRYPDAGMGLDEYNEELGIVQQFDKIFDRVVFFREELDNLFDRELEKHRNEKQ